MSLTIRIADGAAIEPHVEHLARLRIEVFAEYPYLYAGNRRYEEKYLRSYVECAEARVILAFDADECVGASTVMPLRFAEEAVRAPFVGAGYRLESIDYFGESVVRRSYRGRGLGVRFFEEREKHALEHGLELCVFCAVDRDAADPRRPSDYRGNDAFWSKRGYRRASELRSAFSWPDLGEERSTEKSMTYYVKTLGGPA